MTIDQYTEKVKQERRKIPNAPNYEIDADGFVYRNGNKLRLRRQGQRWYAQVYDRDGRHHYFDSERLARVLFHSEETVMTLEDIKNNFKVRPVPGFTRYLCTSYGAVYCIDPPKRGKNAGSCYLVHESLSRDKPYVTLYKKDGTSLRRQVSWVVKQAWG
tara:strand:+ start:651 stop:1127 length:477 start_codon:yes stop_codon:yes gene_type:complete